MVRSPVTQQYRAGAASNRTSASCSSSRVRKVINHTTCVTSHC